MKEIEFSVLDNKREDFKRLLQETLDSDTFKDIDKDKVYTFKDITTAELETIRICEKLCQAKETLERTN